MEQQTAVRIEKGRGALTIFASYFSGTGKTFRLLEAATQVHRAGGDVVIGLLSCSQWPQTQAMAEPFESMPQRAVTAGDDVIYEIDLDACLKRRPQILLIDDLSHVNAEGSRHKNRYRDIEELLKAGIDVYTTVDIQHIESIQETVFEIFGAPESERIPDCVFDQASHVEFIDMEPEQLQNRLKQGCGARIPSAGCTLSQLNALRELGLRRCADRSALYASTQPAQSQALYRMQEHILVCLSSAPSNAQVIRTAARMAGAFRCGFTALFVETSKFQWMPQSDRERLRDNLKLAQKLGASIETVYGDDIAYQIAEYSRLSGITKIVLGRDMIPHRYIFRKASLTEQLIELAPDFDIHIIPDNRRSNRFTSRYREVLHTPSVSLIDLAKSILILALATIIGFLFHCLGLNETNIITVYILGVMLTSVFTKNSVYSLINSIAGVLAFNFFFTEPRFSLNVHSNDYPVTFVVMFVVSFLTSSLAAKLKSLAKHSAQMAWRTKILLETSQDLQKAGSQTEILSIIADQLLKILQRDIVVYCVKDEKLQEPEILLAEESDLKAQYTTDQEKQVAQWVLTNNKRAGAGTETFSDARCTYLSVRAGEHIYGVVGVAAAGKGLETSENSILLSVLEECALAMENQRHLEEKEAAAVLAKNEQLRANLLRSISHDLRTPLTSISGNASNLLSNGDMFDAKTRQQMYTDIYDDSIWLINLVENLLSVSRLDGGRMNLHISTELVDDVVSEALRHINRKSVDYHLHTQGDDYLLAQMDARLIVQVVINLVDNAIKYTPPGSDIDISWKRQGKYVLITVADNGPGISDEAKPHIFDMFYSASNQIVDSRRSMGLGLALCKSIVNAHGGEITVSDQLPHGAMFTFSIPAREVDLHE